MGGVFAAGTGKLGCIEPISGRRNAADLTACYSDACACSAKTSAPVRFFVVFEKL